MTDQYQFSDIEKNWQKKWKESSLYKVEIDPSRPKYYVLDMFPYPSGAGLHVGHPLGYIASDIVSRYKRLEGFNVLHPMGYDAFGLPSEQYAIQTGQHPAVTTEANISRYREQLDQLGLSFDWSREVRTCEPAYYKWTQWVFLKLFEHWYDNKQNKARPIADLEAVFAKEGNQGVDAAHSCKDIFSAEQWQEFDEQTRRERLLDYRLAYLADTFVNWCPALGTVLANDEVKDGFSERGGHPVEQRKMKQWSLRITAYADRLLEGLHGIDWPESVKEMQRNWIGRSEGASVRFALEVDAQKRLHSSPLKEEKLEVFTTRPDTIFGVEFAVLAPESLWVEVFTSDNQKAEVEAYQHAAKLKSERERLAESKTCTGVFTGGYCLHPFTGKKIPVWIADYVIASYGAGAVMAVPAHDARDYQFAKTFDLPITSVIEGGDIEEEAFIAKDGVAINSEFLNGLKTPEAISKAIIEIEKGKFGKGMVNFRLRDAIFSRQRYWGEPFPIKYIAEQPYSLSEEELPVVLPEVDKYLPTSDGDPPLGRADHWASKDGYPLELSIMPGFAGSSAYYLRYMDPHNDKSLVSKEANEYWQDVDLYMGGAEHATGHLLYSRFWNKFLYDMGEVVKDEPFKKLFNQGMIQGRSSLVYRVKGENTFVTLSKKDQYDVSTLHVDVSFVSDDLLDTEQFKNWREEFKEARFILNEDGQYECGVAVEKMSKSLFNVVNPDQVVEKYGADTMRLYEMFLGPLEQAKPWNTNGIEGVHRFLNRFWRLFFSKSEGAEKVFHLSDEAATADELKALHTVIKKVRFDVENMQFNTAVSAFMICVNDLIKMSCHKRAILEPLVVLLSPFCPHVAEELWSLAGHTESVFDSEALPVFEEKYLVESSFSYPVSLNGKMKFLLELPMDLDKGEIEKRVLEHDKTKSLLEGKNLRKMIVVPKKIVNIVAG